MLNAVGADLKLAVPHVRRSACSPAGAVNAEVACRQCVCCNSQAGWVCIILLLDDAVVVLVSKLL